MRWRAGLLAILFVAGLWTVPVRAAVAVQPLPKQAVWETGPTPIGRTDAVMAFDSRRGRLVLFGGRRGQQLLGDTWEWDGQRWHAVATRAAPRPRAGSGMAYDPDRDRTVLFGGCCTTDGRTFGDTWEWDGTTWTHRMATSSPPPRHGHVVVHAGGTGPVGVLVLAGTPVASPQVADTAAVHGDTWRWDGTSWTELATSGTYPGRYETAAVGIGGAVWLAGGCCARSGGRPLPDTWVFAGARWRPASNQAALPGLGPVLSFPRRDHAMGISPNGLPLVFGGAVWTNREDAAQWEGRLAAWIRMPQDGAVPPARRGAASASDLESRATYVFGGRCCEADGRELDDLWVFQGGGWRLLAPVHPPALEGMAVADEPGEGVLAFGGTGLDGQARADTWRWRDGAWQLLQPTASPPERTGASLAWDAERDQVVLFGGAATDGSALDDTWLWDGTTWSQAVGPGPPARSQHAMAFHASRREVVVVGGRGDDDAVRGDTWAWDGARWAERTADGPARAEHVLAAHAPSGELVLFGGQDGDGAVRGETFTWDGAGWTAEPPGPVDPVPRRDAAAASLASGGHVVVYGGIDAAGVLSATTSLWDGRRWWLGFGEPRPRARAGHAMALDAVRGHVVLVSGALDPPLDPWRRRLHGDTWALTGTDGWHPLTPLSPAGRRDGVFATDHERGGTLLFGGFDGHAVLRDTWRSTGGSWMRHIDARPPTRSGSAAAWDASSRTVLMFGGRHRTGDLLGDTWQWDGLDWRPVPTEVQPPARVDHALVAEPGGGVLLFGGRAADGTPLGDSWRFADGRWSELLLPVAPAPRSDHAMAAESDGGAVLFAGRGSDGYLSDTWRWDGHRWTRLVPDVAPLSRAGHAMASDPTTGLVVLFGGEASKRVFGDTWIFDGGLWHELTTAGAPAPRTGHGMAADPSTGTITLVGGSSSTGTENAPWHLRLG